MVKKEVFLVMVIKSGFCKVHGGPCTYCTERDYFVEDKCIYFGHVMNEAVEKQRLLTQCIKPILHTKMYVGIQGQILSISLLQTGSTGRLLFQRNIVMVTVEHF